MRRIKYVLKQALVSVLSLAVLCVFIMLVGCVAKICVYLFMIGYNAV
jgi:hypothetical protein